MTWGGRHEREKAVNRDPDRVSRDSDGGRGRAESMWSMGEIE